MPVDVDHAIPILDLPALQRRVRHQAGIVDDHVDAAVQPDGVIDQVFDLIDLRYVGFDDGIRAQAEVGRDRLQPVETPSAENEPCAVPCQTPCGGFSEAAARAGDDDDPILDAFRHGAPFPFVLVAAQRSTLACRCAG